MSEQKCDILMLLDNAFTSDMRVEKEAGSLVKAGFRVVVMCQVGHGLPESEIRNGISILRAFPRFFRNPIGRTYTKEAAQLVAKILRWDFRVLHCHDHFMLAIGAQAKALRPDIHLTYDSHEYLRGWPYYQDIPNGWNRLKGRLVWWWLVWRESRDIRRCDMLIAASPAIGERLEKDHKLDAKIIIPVRNISDIGSRVTNGENTDLRKLLNIPASGRIMVQSGNIYQNPKLLRAMFDVVVTTPALHFIIINNRPIAAELEAKIKKHPVWAGRIHMVGYEEAKLAVYLRAADFGLLYMKTDKWHSHYLTSPNRIMEYTVMGLPFVSVPQAEAEELHRAFGHVVFFGHTTASFSRALTEMLETLADKKTKAARARGHFRWDVEFKPVVKWYESIR